MSNDIKTIVAFLIGGALGSLVTYKIVKDKCEVEKQEEINSVKEVFGRKVQRSDSDLEEEEYDDEEFLIRPEETAEERAERVAGTHGEKSELDLEVYKSMLNAKAYKNYATVGPELGREDAPDKIYERPLTPPYVISPDEYDAVDGYEPISLFLYSDEVLADDMNMLVEDIEGTIGLEALDSFGTFEGTEDAVYVRNDALKADYEILKIEKTYEEACAY